MAEHPCASTVPGTGAAGRSPAMKVSYVPTNHFIHAQWILINNYKQAVLPERRLHHGLPGVCLAC